MSRDAATKSNHSQEIELSTGNNTNTQTFLKKCVLDANYKTLAEYLVSNPVQQSDLDKCLLHGLQIVQLKESELSHIAPGLTLLLQTDAKWNSDDLLAEQKTPYHIICESPGDHHELLDDQKTPYHTICESGLIDTCQSTMGLNATDMSKNVNIIKNYLVFYKDQFYSFHLMLTYCK